MKGLPYEVKTLIQKARESAMLAVETYNRPTASFRSGAYVVLMTIAWTSLFHAIFFRQRIKPFQRKPNSRLYVKVDGEPKRWDLKECLQQFYKGENPPVRMNLEFFIRLRNKIEHCSLAQLDPGLFGECQAMLLNFESTLASKFGARYAIHGGLSLTLQFSKDGPQKSSAPTGKSQQRTFKAVKQFVDAFRSGLSTEVQDSLEYSFKVYLVPKIGNHASSDAVAVEFVKYDPAKPEEMKQYERVVAMIKPKEVRVANLGFLKAGQVAAQVSKKLGRKFSTYDNQLCYRHFNARPKKGAPDPSSCDMRYCQYDDLHKDYGYDPAWVDFLSEKLSDSATYELIILKNKRTGKTSSAAEAQGIKKNP